MGLGVVGAEEYLKSEDPIPPGFERGTSSGLEPPRNISQFFFLNESDPCGCFQK